MYKRFFSILILCSGFILLSFSTNAQNLKVNKGKKVTAKQKTTFKDRLWYGGSFVLNYYNQNYYSAFTLGITPMVGYKVFGEFSVGPRLGLTFTNYRENIGSKVDKLALFETSEGLFARYKFLKVVFAHAEFNFTQSQYPSNQLTPTGGLQKISINSQNAYAGLGYNSGMGDFGSEIYILYNFLADDNIVTQPFEIRFGLTYKF
ncbi:MAG: hypothetical protein M9911_00015 [Saprospiraceae bacterium]|nr:hypothetical protein [Saprospiraceae bacterium]